MWRGTDVQSYQQPLHRGSQKKLCRAWSVGFMSLKDLLTLYLVIIKIWGTTSKWIRKSKSEDGKLSTSG